jgi:hypothetical protein
MEGHHQQDRQAAQALDVRPMPRGTTPVGAAPGAELWTKVRRWIDPPAQPPIRAVPPSPAAARSFPRPQLATCWQLATWW